MGRQANKDTGFRLNYQSIGSGGGINQIKAKTVTFGASDMPLEPKDLIASLIQFPTVVGGDVPVVNLDGIGAGDPVLDGPTLANIFLGKITKWDDPAIKKLNPNVKLPSSAISSCIVPTDRGRRSSSRTICPKSARIGNPTSAEHIRRMAGRHRRQRQRGCLKQRHQTKGAIGYVEYA